MSSLESRALRDNRSIDGQWIHENEAREYKINYYDRDEELSPGEASMDVARKIKEILGGIDFMSKEEQTIYDDIDELNELVLEKEKETGIDFSENKLLIADLDRRVHKVLNKTEASLWVTKVHDAKILIKDHIDSSIRMRDSTKKYKEKINTLLPDILEEIEDLSLEKGKEIEELITNSINEFNAIDINKDNVDTTKEILEKYHKVSSIIDSFIEMDETLDILKQNGIEIEEIKNEMGNKLLAGDIIDRNDYISQTENAKMEELNIENEGKVSDITPLDFTEYTNQLMEKYNASDYHRMLNKEETLKFIELYGKAFGVEKKQAKDNLESTIEKELNQEKMENQIKKQELEQEKLMVLSQNYSDKYGPNFTAYLNEEDLEKYTITYLHAYNTRRSTVEKMYEEALNNEYANKTGTISEVDNNVKSMGFAKAWLLGLLMLIPSIAIFIICIVISK